MLPMVKELGFNDYTGNHGSTLNMVLFTLSLTPLLALMKDQVDSIAERDFRAARAAIDRDEDERQRARRDRPRRRPRSAPPGPAGGR